MGKVEEKQAVLHEEGKMDDGLDFSRSQEEESRTARVIRKCSSLFTQFIRYFLFLLCSEFHLKIMLLMPFYQFSLLRRFIFLKGFRRIANE